jgi:hypothetical protein
MAVLSEIIRVWNPARNRRNDSTRRPHNRIRPSAVPVVVLYPPHRGIAQNGMDFPKITYVIQKWKPFDSIFRVCGWEFFEGRLVDATQPKGSNSRTSHLNRCVGFGRDAMGW